VQRCWTRRSMPCRMAGSIGQTFDLRAVRRWFETKTPEAWPRAQS
jgi:hypothetical protein